ncbi:MAG: histidine--tRNA ligase [Bacteroidetes bacterium]|nr:histidine--tRNA ligase [Bacteroidota bacterium]
MTKPTLPQGTRDFGPEVVRKRNYILNTIKNVFELYGFQPLETPAMENLDTLMGKYGEEGDKLIFKILNNGLDNKEKEKQIKEDFEKVLQGKNVKGITERALKYDLTIPLARFVAMNHNTLTFPFKRYQIQPVWRADRPQKGRYREFYQCDADVVGSNSLLNELELANIYAEVFTRLGLKGFEIKINHRKLVTALAELCGGAEKMNDIAIAIDKLDKVGLEKVKEELSGKGLDSKRISIVESYLNISGGNEDKISALKKLFGDNETAHKGIEELEWLKDSLLTAHYLPLTIDPTLARGLNYYTGIIFEVKPPAAVKMGSIGGGGRYDDLTGLFGVPNIPGVGISFGVDRIYDVMEELNLFPANLQFSTQVLFFNLGEKESKKAFELMQQLRHNGIRCELYHEAVKFDKQFKYAENKNIPFVVIIGEKEMQSQTCNIKTLATGKQEIIPFSALLNYNFGEK